MIIKFKEEFGLSLDQIYSYFQTPADWTRLYGLEGKVMDMGDGWYSISLKDFRFPLVAKIISQERNRFAHWVFRGFWKGQGKIRLTQTSKGVIVEGFEEISVRWLFALSPFFEKYFLEKRFRLIWKLGWKRLRKLEVNS